MRLGLVIFALMAGCTREHPLDLEIHAPDGGVGASVVSIEVRVYRLDGDAVCPSSDAVALAQPVAPLAHAQAFDVASGMGVAIGEIPPGRWAVMVIGRDASCTSELAGCTIVDVGPTAMGTIVVDLVPRDPLPGCGSCRTCTSGACVPFDSICS